MLTVIDPPRKVVLPPVIHNALREETDMTSLGTDGSGTGVPA